MEQKGLMAAMFLKQEALMQHYIKIEGLPMYPVDINSRVGQKVIKDFIGRFLEEIVEAHTSLETCYNLMSDNKSGEALKELHHYNIEIADAWHFLLELILYLGYDQKLDRIFATLPKNMVALIKEDNDLATMLNIGGYINYAHGYRVSGSAHFTMANEIDTKSSMMNPMGNKRISEEILQTQSIILWNLTCSLKGMSNLLKNRDWTQEDKLTNLMEMEKTLAETLIIWGQYLEYGKFSQHGINHFYSEKNEENLMRIKKGY